MKGRKRIGKKITCSVLLLAMMCTAVGCGSAEPSGDLMKEYNQQEDVNIDVSADAGLEEKNSGGAEYLYTDGAIAISDFGVQLINQCYPNSGNVLISPLSVISALAMTANGAKAETLTQMENVFGMELSGLNIFLKDYRESLPEGDKYKMNLANAIWFRDAESFTVKEAFLQANAEYFDAGVYKAAFDSSTMDEINGWVRENTDGMIREILSEIPKEAVMYLVNALAFDGEWETIYNENHIRQGKFTQEDGTVEEAELMYSEESVYLEDEKAQGFVKYYADEKYAFVALLPKEGITVEEYLVSMDGENLQETLKNPVMVKVNAGIPKFENEYSVEMSEVLRAMGMEAAFLAEEADFSGIGESAEGNLFINRVLHKTFIAVDERGTKAGAVTAVEVVRESAVMEPEEAKTIILNRPFVYMIIDCENKVPLFLGTVMEMQ